MNPESRKNPKFYTGKLYFSVPNYDYKNLNIYMFDKNKTAPQKLQKFKLTKT